MAAPVICTPQAALWDAVVGVYLDQYAGFYLTSNS
jgi:hypothetical protein